MDPFCYLCFTFVFIILSCLFLAALERPDLLALLCVMFPCVFVTFHNVVLGQVGYLIVLIPGIAFFFSLILEKNSKDRIYPNKYTCSYKCSPTTSLVYSIQTSDFQSI